MNGNVIKSSEITARGIRFSLMKEGSEIGRAFLYIMQNDLHEEPFGLLEDVWVREDQRGTGAGTQLVKAVIEKAQKEKCYKLIATSRHERTRVHQLYKKLGFKNHGLEFRMELN